MSKTIAELIPSDRVVIRLGARTQRDEDKGEDITIDPEKQIDVAYAYYESLTSDPTEFNAENGHSKLIGRKVHLLGLAEYGSKQIESGDTVPVLAVIPFETEESRAEVKRQTLAEAQLEVKRKQQETQQVQAQAEQRIQQAQQEADQKLAQAAGAINYQNTMMALVTAAQTARQSADKAASAAKTAKEKADRKPDDAILLKAAETAAAEAAKAEADATSAANAVIGGSLKA